MVADETVYSGYPDVVDGVYFIAHNFRSDARFLRNRNIAGPGADHGHLSLSAGFAVAPVANRAAERKIFPALVFVEEALRHFGRGARDKHIFRALQQLRRNGHYMVRTFSEPEYDFRHAVPQGAMVVDFGEAQVFKGEMAHADESRIHIDCAAAHVVKELTELVFGHR
jgi:hypothetical protein